jgi:ferritin-like metal-binding protein YciE
MAWSLCLLSDIFTLKKIFLMPLQNNNYTSTAHIADTKLGEFFTAQLKDIYWAEQHLVKTLPKMQEAATTSQLKQAINNHLAETKQHVIRLEQIFGMIGEDAKGTKCKAMSGITDEGEDIIDDTDEGTSTRDAGIIFAAQKVEHYEIATYGSLIEVAHTLEHDELAAILEQTLTEEKKADEMLTQIARSNVNDNAGKEMKD